MHLGVAAVGMERKGVTTSRGSLNREAYIFNVKLKKLQARIDELKDWLKTETKKDEPTNLVHMIQRILVRIEERRKASLYPTRDDSGIFVETLAFLNEHSIETIDDFKEKVTGLNSRRDVEKFAKMRFRIEILLRQEERRAQKEQQGQRQIHSRGMGR